MVLHLPVNVYEKPVSIAHDQHCEDILFLKVAFLKRARTIIAMIALKTGKASDAVKHDQAAAEVCNCFYCLNRFQDPRCSSGFVLKVNNNSNNNDNDNNNNESNCGHLFP